MQDRAIPRVRVEHGQGEAPPPVVNRHGVRVEAITGPVEDNELVALLLPHVVDNNDARARRRVSSGPSPSVLPPTLHPLSRLYDLHLLDPHQREAIFPTARTIALEGEAVVAGVDEEVVVEDVADGSDGGWGDMPGVVWRVEDA